VLCSDDSYEAARTELLRIGVDGVAGYLRGGVDAWSASVRPLETIEEMSVAELAEHFAAAANGLRILDVRDPSEWAAGHIHGSLNVFAGDIAQGAVPDRANGDALAVICSGGYRSSVAASLLQDQGWRQLVSVPGGMAAWIAAGLPTE
jgi:hydroxyacylglutathione hydrolase